MIKNIQIGILNFFSSSQKKGIGNPYVEEYIDWRRQTYPSAAEQECRWITQFLKFCDCHDICDVSSADVKRYREHVADEFKTRHAEVSAQKTLGCFFAYWHSRNYPCISRETIHACFIANTRR